MAQEGRSTEIVNPYIAGSPVTGTAMFFGREDVFDFIRRALMGRHRDNIIVLYGQRRTGKTSVLYQMHRHLDARYLCIFIDLHGLALDEVDGFLWELANNMARVLRREYQIDLPRPQRAEFMLDARGAFENDFLGQVWSAIGDRRILLMLDEAIRLQEQVRAGKLGEEIFEYLRHLMQHHERLNFLFALGSGLEEMEKAYAFLFSVGLYKKISFLEREAAAALITQPASDYYQVEPAAVERILQITSGHAYYTQLVCHSLFNRWQQQHTSRIQASDVDATLDEVVERGLAVLKHVWEESTSGEKAVLAGMAAVMGNRPRPVSAGDVDRVWARHGIRVPDSEKAKAIKSLITRDVIAGQDRYLFSVDLQRLWVAKYERLEWVKEEIAGDIQQWNRESADRAEVHSASRAGTPLVAFGVVAIGVIVVLAGLLVQRTGELSSANATGTANAIKLGAAAATANVAVNAPDATRIPAEATLQSANATAAAQLGPEPTVGLDQTGAQSLADRINQLRVQNDLTALTFDDRLNAVARQHALYMADTGNITHVGVDGLTFSERIRDSGYTGESAGELIFGGGQATIDDALNWWTSSPIHMDVLRNAAATDVGIGVAHGPVLTYIAVELGAKPAATPTPTPSPTPVSTPTNLLGLSSIVVTSGAVDLLPLAPSATWSNGSGVSGLWLNDYPDASDTLAPRGFASYTPSDLVLEETGVVGNRRVLATHPQFVSNGEIVGSFRLTLPPQGVDLYSTVEFLIGATQSDGVHVEIWWLDDARGSAPPVMLAEVDANNNGRATNLTADMSRYGGQTGEMRLVVKAGATSGEDWLTWTALVVTPK